MDLTFFSRVHFLKYKKISNIFSFIKNFDNIIDSIMNICIIRIDRMGDMVLTLPIIQAIKSANPLIKIDIIASDKNKKILENFKYVNSIFVLKNNQIFIKKKYDIILNFTPGWKSFFLCFFSKSSFKANLILKSRYRTKIFSKLLIIFLSKIFFNKNLIIDRIKNYQDGKTIHQTEIMFQLLEKCSIKYNKGINIEKYLPINKIIKSKKKICLIHLSSKWINDAYTEDNLLELIENIRKKFNLILTTDETSNKKFNLIFKIFSIIKNDSFKSIESINDTIIFDNLNFNNWIQTIYSSDLIITPECGCSHIASLCKIPSKIIYDHNNKPEMIYNEYFPWNSNHEKYIFNDKNLNYNLVKNL